MSTAAPQAATVVGRHRAEQPRRSAARGHAVENAGPWVATLAGDTVGEVQTVVPRLGALICSSADEDAEETNGATGERA